MPTPPKEDVRKQEVEDVKEFMSRPAGRRFVYRLLSKSGMFQSVFRDRPLLTPEQRVVFNGAQRDFGQWIQDEVIACASVEFDRMMGEERERRLLERMAAMDKQPTKEED